MATIQKQDLQYNNIVDNHLWLINDIKGETLKEIAMYLKNRGLRFGYLPDFLKNPDWYPGNKITGLKDIVERFLDLTISKYYKKIQAERLPVKFVINSVREILFQDDWDSKRDPKIMVATRGGDGARKAVSASRTDEPPRLLFVKNKAYNAKSKPKSKKRGPKVKTIKNVKVKKAPIIFKEGDKPNRCSYCDAHIKIRHTSNLVHINVCQNPTYHHFCSKECKINWIFAPLEKKVKEVRI